MQKTFGKNSLSFLKNIIRNLQRLEAALSQMTNEQTVEGCDASKANNISGAGYKKNKKFS